MKRKDTSIAISNKELGKQLLQQAEKEFQKDKGDAVIRLIKEIVKKREFSLYWKQTNEYAAEFYQKQLDAINSGAFEMSPTNGVITFHDETIRKDNYARADQPPKDEYKEHVQFLNSIIR